MFTGRNDIQILLESALTIFDAIANDPIIYLPLIGAWLVTSLYFIINSGCGHGDTYIMSTGITLLFTAYVISPFARHDLSWHFGDMRTIIVTIISVYGFLLIKLGISKVLPPFLEEFFGDSSHALTPMMMTILFIEEQIPFDWITLVILAIPVSILKIIKLVRKLKS